MDNTSNSNFDSNFNSAFDNIGSFWKWWMVCIIVVVVLVICTIIVCICFALRARRRSDHHSKHIGVHVTPGEVVSPLTTGPYAAYTVDGTQGQPYQQQAYQPYEQHHQYQAYQHQQPEDMVLVPRTMLQQHGIDVTQPLPTTIYPDSHPHPSEAGVDQNQAHQMESIRQSSGVYLSQTGAQTQAQMSPQGPQHSNVPSPYQAQDSFGEGRR